jgi:hypothetical protein
MSKIVMGITMEDDREPIVISRDRVVSLYAGKYIFLTQEDKKKAIIPITWCCTEMKNIMERRNGRKIVSAWKVCPYCTAPVIKPEPAEYAGQSKPNGQKRPSALTGRVWIYNTQTKQRRIVLPDAPLPEGWAYLKKEGIAK